MVQAGLNVFGLGRRSSPPSACGHYTARLPRVNSPAATPRARPITTPASTEAGSSQATAGKGRRRTIPRWYEVRSTLGKPNSPRLPRIPGINSILVFPGRTRSADQKPSGKRENLSTQVQARQRLGTMSQNSSGLFWTQSGGLLQCRHAKRDVRVAPTPGDE
jgi:hypothetical protein